MGSPPGVAPKCHRPLGSVEAASRFQCEAQRWVNLVREKGGRNPPASARFLVGFPNHQAIELGLGFGPGSLAENPSGKASIMDHRLGRVALQTRGKWASKYERWLGG